MIEMDRAKKRASNSNVKKRKIGFELRSRKMQKLDTNGFEHKRARSLVTGSARFLRMQTFALKLAWPYIYGHNRIPVKTFLVQVDWCVALFDAGILKLTIVFMMACPFLLQNIPVDCCVGCTIVLFLNSK